VHPAARHIPDRVQSRLKDIGYAKEVSGGIVLTDDGFRRIAIDRGQGFAAGYPETAKLSEVMLHLNETSLSQLRRDHETDHLEHKIAQASK